MRELPPVNLGNQSDTFSAGDVMPVTPSDTVDLPFIARAIRAKVGGDLRITSGAGIVRDTFIGEGELLPVTAIRIHATGTTATGLEALK